MRSTRYIIAAFLVFSLLQSCAKVEDAPGLGEPDLTILYTNDEHGWISETTESGGAAKLMGLWRDNEGYSEDGPFLVLSGGDNWTGQAISTWFQGESVVETMNAMGYDAAAIGNHEFDFEVSGLRERVEQADFPYLSANIRKKSDGSIPDFAQPYVLLEVNDILVGIIGLTTVSTSYSTFPTYVEDYNFIAYEGALEEWVPQVWAEGVDIVICITHLCGNEMRNLIPLARELDISMIGGGHCNELISEVQGYGEVALLEGGWGMRYYAHLDIWYNAGDMKVEQLAAKTRENQGGSPDPTIESIVSIWEAATEEALGNVIGYVENTIDRNDTRLHNLITDSWLYNYPNADIAFTNTGGIRQSIVAGEITKGDIIGVLPFNNNILELNLTGEELITCLGSHAVAGMNTIDGYWHADGTPLKMDSTYSVLTTDYLYVQDATLMSTYDPNPYYTNMNYHQPTVDYILSLNTNTTNPLDDYLDPLPRR